MSKEYTRRLATDEKHIRHVALEMVANHLEAEAEKIVDNSIYTYDYDAQEELEEYTQQEEDVEAYEIYAEPLTRAMKKLAGEVKAQAEDLQKECVCYDPDEKRVHAAVSNLLHQLPLPFDSAFVREDEEGYRLKINDQVIFQGLDGDAAIEATRRYVSARVMNPDLPSNTPDGLNEQPV